MMASPAASLLSASAAGKASRVFASSVHGYPAAGTSGPDPVGGDQAGEELRDDIHRSLAAVWDALRDQRSMTSRLIKEVKRLQ